MQELNDQHHNDDDDECRGSGEAERMKERVSEPTCRAGLHENVAE